jgi:spermidine synthase
VTWLFVVAYTSSGLAGLIYQVCWTRLLTLFIGHTTGAASTVVAAFLGGLAVGAAIAARYAPRLTPRQALAAYAALEIVVAAIALALPLEIRALTPLLAATYADGASPVLFPVVRFVACLVIVWVPATALGATFPLAVRWFTADSRSRARAAGALYALNTAGAASGALLAGFVLIPSVGVSGTTWAGVAASAGAALCALVVARRSADPGVSLPRSSVQRTQRRRPAMSPRPEGSWLAPLVLGISGFAALLYEIAWTRVLTMVFGPTTYAFAATLAAVITGIAVGSMLGTALVTRTRQHALWLAAVLAAAAAVGIFTSSVAGGPLPRYVAEQIAQAPDLFAALLWRGGLLTAMLILPTSALLGAAFPLALAMVDDPGRSAARQFGAVYAFNSVGSVAGALGAGFVFIPLLGLEATLRVVTLSLCVTAVLVVSLAPFTGRARLRAAVASAIAIVVMFLSPAWDRELLASGVYLYAPFVPPGLPLEPLLKAGSLLYYREGAAATVSVKRLTGTHTLAVDGKTDASNRGDMLTQKLVAHLPLLLHEAPRSVAIIGLGSGVTVGAALTHPIARADVIELSPEVVEASHVFRQENRNAVADARTRLLIADGRSHLQLATTKYDVIISEPSNPWIAGVAALFTREFFVAARDRLAPGGLICQWANAYNISDHDLRSIVATFQSVFPHGTAWLVGGDDVVLIAAEGPLEPRLALIEANWSRPGVAEDLSRVAAVQPFTLWSLFVAGPAALDQYGRGAPLLTDNLMALEFSAPRELGSRRPGANSAALRALLDNTTAPAVIRDARAEATATEWRHRGAMMERRDAFTEAYEDYGRALTLDLNDADALAGLIRTAALTGRHDEALKFLEAHEDRASRRTPFLVARSQLLASRERHADALRLAERALAFDGDRDQSLGQLASLHADAGRVDELHAVVDRMQRELPDDAATYYYAAAARLQSGAPLEAVRLAERALRIDPGYAAAYDLLGAASVRLGRPADARAAFEKSLTFDAHDSTAYTNLGVLALEAGDNGLAADYFAEALWLDADSAVAREGLLRAWRR